jgi:hypothetical protein
MNEATDAVIIDLPAEGAPIGATDAGSSGTTGAAGSDVVDIKEDKDQDDLPDHAVKNADGSITLPLLYPVVLKFRRPSGDIREESLAELVLHRLTGADMRAISSSNRDGLSTVAIARSARINEAKMNAWFDRMDGADTVAAGQVVAHFLGNGPKTGR